MICCSPIWHLQCLHRLPYYRLSRRPEQRHHDQQLPTISLEQGVSLAAASGWVNQEADRSEPNLLQAVEVGNSRDVFRSSHTRLFFIRPCSRQTASSRHPPTRTRRPLACPVVSLYTTRIRRRHRGMTSLSRIPTFHLPPSMAFQRMVIIACWQMLGGDVALIVSI